MAGRALTTSPAVTTMPRVEWIPVLIRLFAERALGDGGWLDEEEAEEPAWYDSDGDASMS